MSITHEPSLHRFVATQAEGRGELRYRIRPDGVVDIFHTEVDPALQGEGVAGALAAAAFADARARGLKVKVTCPYVAGWLERHPEERDIVVGG